MSNLPEPLVARVTGVSREIVAAARKASLVKAADWTLENSVVCYSPDGLKKLLAALGLANAPLTWPSSPTATGDRSATPPRVELNGSKNSGSSAVAARVAAAGADDAARPLVALKVTALSRNPSVLHAVTGELGRADVLVRVRSNVNFTIGMPIKARAPAAGFALYHFEGNCPRWKGRY